MNNFLNLRLQAERAAQDYPALLAEAEQAVATFLHGDIAMRKSGSGQKFWQFREYQPGDSPRDIDWRRSARSDTVFTREKEQHSPQTTYLWCSLYEGMEFASKSAKAQKAEHAKILTLALSILLSRGGESIGLLGHGRALRGAPAIESAGNILCEESAFPAPLPERSALPRHARFIAIGDFLEPIETIESALLPYFAATRDGVIVQILDPAEITLPFKGRYIFEAPFARIREQIDNAADIRKSYQKRIKNHNFALERLCEDHNWHFVRHVTDTAPGVTLGKLWQAMHKEGQK